MCRLLYVPPKTSLTRKALAQLCVYLETRCGGDGNGCAAVKAGAQPLTYKGATAPAEKIGRMLWQYSAQGFHGLYHTRKATHGIVNDDNCQPFIARGCAIAHNGIWMDGATIAAGMCPEYSDSRVLARIWQERGPKYLKNDSGLWPPSGVWMFVSPKSQRVRVPAGGFADMQYDPRSGCWASEFPKCRPFRGAYEVAVGTHPLHVRKARAPARGAPCGYGFKGWSKGAINLPRSITDTPSTVPDCLACYRDTSGKIIDADDPSVWPSRSEVYGVDAATIDADPEGGA